MKKTAFRFFALFLVGFFSLSLVVPTFATANSEYISRDTFWNWVAGNGGIVQKIVGYTLGTGVCPNSDDGYHHANSYQKAFEDGYYNCICYECGQTFKAYESDLRQSYNDYVGTLPSTIYDSTGTLSWKIVPYIEKNANPSMISAVRYADYVSVVGSVPSGGYERSVSLVLGEQFKAPVDGTYKITLVTSASFLEMNFTCYSQYLEGRFAAAGSVVLDKTAGGATYFYLVEVPITSDTAYWYGYLLLTCIPFSVPSSSYSATTRPTGITGGNYGIVGDNGQITTVVDNSTIINETNNTYYNPATGQKEKITSWTYDYSDRSYHITLESGDTITVTYGDENITINEGDTIYNIYYIMDGSGSGEVCEHEWYQTGAVQGNCLTPTQRTYTCSKCNKQYTETDSAPGHSWRIIQTVATKYDDNGKLIQEGYTIYECERCGEQYKSSNDIGPPASGGSGSGGSSGSGSGGNVFSGIFGIIWDFFTFFFDFFSDFVVGGIKGFISALLDVGSDFFAILNPFDWGY